MTSLQKSDELSYGLLPYAQLYMYLYVDGLNKSASIFSQFILGTCMRMGRVRKHCDSLLGSIFKPVSA